jgi:hypothetical protein
MPPRTHPTRTQRQANRHAAQQAADEALARHLQSHNISVPETFRKRLKSSHPSQTQLEEYRQFGDLQGDVLETGSGSGDFASFYLFVHFSGFSDILVTISS